MDYIILAGFGLLNTNSLSDKKSRKYIALFAIDSAILLLASLKRSVRVSVERSNFKKKADFVNLAHLFGA